MLLSVVTSSSPVGAYRPLNFFWLRVLFLFLLEARRARGTNKAASQNKGLHSEEKESADDAPVKLKS
jgi:hypothetical protein